MRYRGALIGTLLMAVAGSAWTADGFVSLLDGKSTSGWTEIGNGNWRVEDGVLIGDKGKSGILISTKTYKDFTIRAEFWISEEGNSGIFIRGESATTMTSKNAYEVNIFDKRPDPTYASGAIVDTAKPSQPMTTGGKWNTYEITAKGTEFTVTLNGVRTVDGVKDDKHASGHIGLQSDGGVVKFRKLEIKEL